MKWESNNTVYDRLARQDLKCPLCKPNQGENCKRHAKHGVKKPKKKDHRSR